MKHISRAGIPATGIYTEPMLKQSLCWVSEGGIFSQSGLARHSRCGTFQMKWASLDTTSLFTATSFPFFSSQAQFSDWTKARFYSGRDRKYMVWNVWDDSVFLPQLTFYSTMGSNWRNNSVKVTVSSELTVVAYFVWNIIPILPARKRGYIFKEHLLIW